MFNRVKDVKKSSIIKILYKTIGCNLDLVNKMQASKNVAMSVIIRDLAETLTSLFFVCSIFFLYSNINKLSILMSMSNHFFYPSSAALSSTSTSLMAGLGTDRHVVTHRSAEPFSIFWHSPSSSQHL